MTPTLEQIDAPEPYRPELRRRQRDPQKEAKLTVWTVHATPRWKNAGHVVANIGFEDSPDCELIADGINSKGPGMVALARQGHWFKWGFCGSPVEMTEEARRVFVNTVVYMKRFDGRAPLDRLVARPRDYAAWYAAGLERGGSRGRRAKRNLAPHLIEQSRGHAATLVRLLKRNRDYIGIDADGKFDIDDDARALGIANRDPALLERCVALLERGEDVERARRLLRRYTREEHALASEWRAWLDRNRERLYFTDTGGYVWRAKPE